MTKNKNFQVLLDHYDWAKQQDFSQLNHLIKILDYDVVFTSKSLIQNQNNTTITVGNCYHYTTAKKIITRLFKIFFKLDLDPDEDIWTIRD